MRFLEQSVALVASVPLERSDVIMSAEQKKKVLEAFGGKRGLIDSGLPALIFLVVFNLRDSLRDAIYSALALSIILTIWRLIRRDTLQHAISGIVGVLICAWFARNSGKAEDFYLPGLITNVVYGSVYLVANLAGFPILGLMLGPILGENLAWRKDPARKRAYTHASWLWVGLFLSRLVVQYPLYRAGNVDLLGIARLAMGYPLFLAVAWGSWLIIRTVPITEVEKREEE
jgi:hypothetical protein